MGMPTNRPANRPYNKPLTTPAARAERSKRFRANEAAEKAAQEIAERDATLRNIAALMGFEDLETRNSDSADFKEIAVWSLKNALERAYAAGKASK